MSDTTTAASSSYDAGSTIRPLSVRMTEDTRAQLDILAQLNQRSVTDEVREALEHWIEKSKTDPKVLKRAEAVRADIEAEATLRRNAIEAIFDGGARGTAGKPSATSHTSRAESK
jgi:hypothetical protein